MKCLRHCLLILLMAACTPSEVPGLLLKTSDGKELKLDECRKTVVVFWGSWCGPCKPELEALKALYASEHREFEVVSIALEKAPVTAFDRVILPWPFEVVESHPTIYLSESAIKFGVTSIPALFYIDGSGRIHTLPNVEALQPYLAK